LRKTKQTRIDTIAAEMSQQAFGAMEDNQLYGTIKPQRKQKWFCFYSFI
jgi:hypothetical protein